ncbi:hypothetical protein A8B79_10030 [Balneola sp. EhC07]|uniref:hypothetical protein n=1 Tax=Balneola sp. EhC07 TaxID=1849360 RepID=UPI0007F3E524|nr:hypothetical protein [Balneola sp. EhC07]OAN60283.1 hypothetical protein A8B79_10030 [Balneola sp. EhC07]
MVKGRTVLVIGAGASYELGFSLGTKLKEDIANLLSFGYHNRDFIYKDELIYETIRVYSSNNCKTSFEDLINASNDIHRAMPLAISIDHFLDAHKGNSEIEFCGKIGIARAILDQEKSSKIYFDRLNDIGPDFNFKKDIWLTSFFQILTENCKRSDLPERFSKFTLIIFNYDRSVEHFLYHALQYYYKLSPFDAREILSYIEIYHPYGTVGTLPWMEQDNSIEFGKEPTAYQLMKLAEELNTFTEGVTSQKNRISKIRASISNSDLALFLGFAYHPMNLRLLRKEKGTALIANRNEMKCIGTAYKISFSDLDIINSELVEMGFKAIEIENTLTCSDLFKNRWRTLSLAKI